MQFPFTIDYQMILICTAVFIVSAVLIYFTASVSMREKPYEEILAEQKRRQDEILEKTKDVKKVDKKKKYKKGKGSGGKTEEHGTDDEKHEELAVKTKETSGVAKVVHLQLEPNIIDESEGETSKKQKPHKVQVKPILINKDEKSAVLPNIEAPELFHTKIPKDDLELKHEHDRRRSSSGSESYSKVSTNKAELNHSAEPAEEEPEPSESKKGNKKIKKKAKEPVDDAVVETVECVAAVASKQMTINGEPQQQQPKMKKKAKSQSGTEEGEIILASIQRASLEDVDIKNMVEVLVGKLSSADAAKSVPDVDWTKKGQKNDPLAQVRKELEVKQQNFEEECRKTQAAVLKIQELNAERQKLTSLVRQTQEQMNNQMQETENLKSRHIMEIKSLHASLESAKAEVSQGRNQVQHLLEENKKLQDIMAQSNQRASSSEVSDELRQKVKVMEDALNQNVLRYNSVDNAKKNLEIKVKQYEEQIQRKDANIREMAQRYNEVTEELRKYESRCNSLSQSLHCLEQEKAGGIEELKTLDLKLRESESKNNRLEAQLNDLGHNCHQKDIELKALSEEMERIKRDSTVHQEHVQSHADNERTAKLLSDNEGIINQLKLSVELQKEKIVELEAEKKNLKLLIEDLELTKPMSEASDLMDSSAASRMVIELSEKSNQLEIVSRDLANLRAQNAALQKSQGCGDVIDASASLKEVEILANQLRERDSTIIELQENIQQLKSLQEKHEEAQNVITDLKNKDAVVYQQHEELVKSYEDKIKELEAKLNQLSHEAIDTVSISKERINHLEDVEAKWKQHEGHLSSLASKISVTEAEMESLREKLAEQSRRSEEIGHLETKLRNTEMELKQLQNQRNESSAKLAHYDELLARETLWVTSEAKTLDAEKRLVDIEQSLQKLKEKEIEWKAVEEKYNKLKCREQEFSLIEQKMRESEAKWEEKDRRFSELLDNEARVMSQLESACEREEGLQKKLDELNSLGDIKSKLQDTEQKLQQKVEDYTRLESRCNELETLSKNITTEPADNAATEQFKELQVEMSAKVAELKKVSEELAKLQRENSDLKSSLQTNAQSHENNVENTSVDRRGGTSKEITVVKRVQEKSEWDMSQLVLELETKSAELEIMQMLLGQKEADVKALESDKAKLLQSLEAQKSVKSQQVPESNTKEIQELQHDLSEAKQGQSKLESQIEHYKAVLSDTETMLTVLQKNVESEDLKWQKRLLATEEQLNTANEEIRQLQSELAENRGSTELNSKAESLERRIEEVESEKLEALLQLSQLRSNYESITNELIEMRSGVGKNVNV